MKAITIFNLFIARAIGMGIIAALALKLFSCSQEKTEPVIPVAQETGTVTDMDGNTYKTIKIGTQWWMAENLEVIHYQNGDTIPNVTSDTEWTNLLTGAYCHYDNSEANVTTYGRLYNWYAINDSRGIAPKGWHVPSDKEWKQLEMFFGMSPSAANDIGHRGTDEGGKLKETGYAHWLNPNTDATNTSGFFALPGGYRSGYDGNYGSMGGNAMFWSATKLSINDAWARYLCYNDSEVYRFKNYKPYGFSVRLVRDNCLFDYLR
jgi:uncharacterized protein (TIGR02145 family)